ncbi:MAG: DUF4197 domain-containing protein [Flavobacteriales bacterium]|nr:DUF4197 domain-containing protein [Flavobacteriales bacterium]
MKHFALISLMVGLFGIGASLSSCDEILDYLQLSDAEVAQALKEALTVGTDTSVARGSVEDGYFGNQIIKILLPPEAQPILSVINSVPGGQSLVNEVVLKVNRAAEQAAVEATPIFVNAITSITIADAMAILNGNDDAATQYLKGATQEEIITAFRPHIVSSLESVGAQSAWETLTTNYNAVAPFLGQPQVNTDLADHTTRKATDGLFVMVAEEETKIRTDVSHQVSALLQRVFGSQQ